MFRDRSEELARLEAELLAEEEPEEDLLPEEEEDEPWEYEDTCPARDQVAYQNYANGYQAYNTDHCDEDLEEYSEEVRRPGRGGGRFLAVIFCALAAIVAVMVWMAIKRGLL